MIRSVLFIVLSFVIVACSPEVLEFKPDPEPFAEYAIQTTNTPSVHERQIQSLDDGTKYLVHPDELLDGGPGKDGIPSIDEPVFETVQEADRWLDESDQIFTITHNGETKGYPLDILVWHEIVNDEFAGQPILATYCPLCGSGVAYVRQINDTSVEFGVSGMLFNSNLVMYDRWTNSYWSQVQGRAIIGPMTGTLLEQIPSNIVNWIDWKNKFTDAPVLSRQTGHDRNYGYDPYGDYYTQENVFFPVQQATNDVFPKETIYGITIDGQYKAYLKNDLEKSTTIVDTFAGQQITIETDDIGQVLFKTNEKIIPHETEFWFAWFAFHPETLVYTPN